MSTITPMESHPTKVYLVDDQTMIRAAFKSLLAKDPRFQVLGDCGDARRAAQAIGTLKPDVVLLDVSMPGLSGIDAIPLIRKEHPRVKVIMLTHHEGESFVEQALRAGADGYLSKDSDPAELALAIESVGRDEMFLSPKVAGVLVHRTRRGHVPDTTAIGQSRIESLTPREREVFQLLALGRSNKEVAKTLSMSVGTAKKHRENLQRKLDCHSAAELALLAIREGLIGN